MLLVVLLLLVLALLDVLFHLWQGSYSHGPSLLHHRSGLLSASSPPSSLLQRLRSRNDGTGKDHPAFQELQELEQAMQHNTRAENTWLNPYLLVSLDKDRPNSVFTAPAGKPKNMFSFHGNFFRVARLKQRMDWQDEWDQLKKINNLDPTVTTTTTSGPKVDYTNPDLYEYPPLETEPPTSHYPKLQPLQDLFGAWPQDDIDHPPSPMVETLQHFDYTTQLDAALAYRERKLPFKLTNVPELLAANLKWTDDYVARHFDSSQAQGKCQESRYNFFAFFQPNGWNVERMGLPPTRNNDWTFREWSEHAKYADAFGLQAQQPHFYWQSGVPKEERELDASSWTFVSKDLPSFSSPDPTFICPDPQEQKGIQCRFGERGVTAATHFDAGKNMVGMITGAKRYVLSPPNQCQHLGIVTRRGNAIFRHSLLNFGHFGGDEKGEEGMSEEERAWLHKAGQSLAVETVLKAGEVLYIPSHWFHYIISLQKSAQCNVRSGVDAEGDEEFGGEADVSAEQCDPTRGS
jgi:hypothetical protein